MDGDIHYSLFIVHLPFAICHRLPQQPINTK